VTFSKHKKAGKPDSLKVTYWCGLMTFSEWLCIEHGGYAQVKGLKELEKFTDYSGNSTTVSSFLLNLDPDEIEYPTRILVKTQLKYPEIVEKIWT
jgi:DNA repair protein RadD